MSSPDSLSIFENEWYTLSQCVDCDVPGYLILQPKCDSAELLNLDPLAQSALGPLFAAIEATLIRITGAERIYILRFSESLASVHFHFFPRSKELAAIWREAQCSGDDQNHNGPLIFAWARVKFSVGEHGRLSDRTMDVANRIRLALGGV
jgi:diadenosine tetraphosphate (Ap4A) HIT family hydrolase